MKKYIYVLLILGAFITLSIFTLKYNNWKINASSDTETRNEQYTSETTPVRSDKTILNPKSETTQNNIETAEMIVVENNSKANNELNNPDTINQINNKPAPATIITNTALQWPISSNIISQYYHEVHKAIDFTATNKQESIVYAAEDGIIKEVGTGYNSGYGTYILIEHKNGLSTHYSHLAHLFVKEGGTIKRGEAIAIAGNTGHATEPHLHFEVRKNGTKVNPLNYIR